MKNPAFLPIFLAVLLVFIHVMPVAASLSAEVTVEGASEFYFSDLDAYVDLNTAELSMFKWNREVSLKIGSLVSPISKTSSTDRVEFQTALFDLNVYKLDTDEGGIEYEIVLYSKPPSNSYAFPVDSENLAFYYQPPLDEELNVAEYDFVNATHAIKDGVAVTHRPENVVGSYAVYHSSKMNNEYKTGKAFHIYRPKAFDSVGKETWLDLDITATSLRISISQEFLDTAVYPVVVDPNFGYETLGASAVQDSTDKIIGSWYTCPEAGTANSITFYLHIGGYDNGPQKLGIYKKSDNTFVGGTAEVSGLTPADWNLVELEAPQPSITAQDYYLVHWGEEYSLRYDAGDEGKGGSDSYGYPNTWLDPWEPTAQSRQYSIYCTYTAAGGEEYERPASQAFSIALTAARVPNFVRAATQAINVALNADSLIEVTRQVSQALGISAAADRLGEFFKSASQAIGLALNAEKLSEFSRAVSQTINISLETSRVAEFVRSASQAISLALEATGIKEALGEFFRNAALTITTALQTSRLIDVARSVSQTITVSLEAIGYKLGEYFREASLALLIRVHLLMGEPGVPRWMLYGMFLLAFTLLTIGLLLGAARQGAQEE